MTSTGEAPRLRRASWQGEVLAEGASTQRVDGYEYFPPEAVRWERLEESDRTSICPWKGMAEYFDVVVDDRRLRDAAWTYRHPSHAARHVAGHVGFWRGVTVDDV